MFSMLYTSTQDEDSIPGWVDKMRDRFNIEETGSGQRRRQRRTSDNLRLRIETLQIRDQDFISKREVPILKRIIRKNRINRLVRNFCLKMKHGIIGSQIPANMVEEESAESLSDHWFMRWFNETQGLALSSLLLSLFSILSIVSIVALAGLYSLSIAFEEIANDVLMQRVLSIAQMQALPIFTLDILLNFVCKRYEEGEALVYLNEIATKYFKGKFLMDFINLALLFVDMMASASGTQFYIFRLFVFLKIPEVLSKAQIVENLFINTFYREQYWGLFNVLLINFTFAHILALLLNGMSKLNPTSNWLTTKGLERTTWSQRYVWGYYWGTTIMLTVGFGDIVATNWQQAICLTFIQMISCISLAYNINCVGNLISNIRQQSRERTTNMKIFQQMAKSNNIERELESKINNYIEESFLMKNQFNFKEQDQLLEYLPQNLKREYLKDVNKRIFKMLPFIKDLTLHSQYLLAEKIARKISHPDEIIINKGEASKCLILRKGLLGMVINSKGCKRSCKVIQTLKICHNEPAKLLNLGFIRHSPLTFTLRSLTYSILYYFQNEDLQQCLRQNSFDYEDYCYQRDKFETGINPDQLYPCVNCRNEFHSLFVCPKLHHIPNRQLVIRRFMHRMKVDKQDIRVPINRGTVQAFKVLKDREFVEEDVENIRMQLSDLGTKISFDTELSMYEQSCRAVRTDGREEEELSCLKQLEDSKFPGLKTIDQKILVAMMSTFAGNDFWPLQIDHMCNWKYYFPLDNPKNLKSRRLKSKKL